MEYITLTKDVMIQELLPLSSIIIPLRLFANHMAVSKAVKQLQARPI
uniref:Uncharacterized protein n=1 Tax=Rhizophora mucronata TaxID=61149 RepID=A0A2P2NA96_RHIMU